MDLLADIAKAFLQACAHAVQEYPLSTLIVFIGVFAVLHTKSLVILIDKDSKGWVKTHYSGSEILFAAIGFVAAVVLSNVLGFLLKTLAEIVSAILSALGIIAGGVGSMTSPFSTHPLEFTSCLLFIGAILTVFLLYSSKWKIKDVRPAQWVLAAIILLVSTYVTTTLVVALTAQPEKTAASMSKT